MFHQAISSLAPSNHAFSSGPRSAVAEMMLQFLSSHYPITSLAHYGSILVLCSCWKRKAEYMCYYNLPLPSLLKWPRKTSLHPQTSFLKFITCGYVVRKVGYQVSSHLTQHRMEASNPPVFLRGQDYLLVVLPLCFILFWPALPHLTSSSGYCRHDSIHHSLSAPLSHIDLT